LNREDTKRAKILMMFVTSDSPDATKKFLAFACPRQGIASWRLNWVAAGSRVMLNQPFFVPAILILLLSIPLVVGLIPPNRGYGIRTAKTLSDDQFWYRANRFGGWALLISSGVYLAAAALMLNFPSASFVVWLLHLGAFGVPLLVSLLLIRRYIGHL
jgi:hypothetical protein